MAHSNSEALREWADALGDGYVKREDTDLQSYESNVSGLKRNILGVLLPSTTEEVQRIVQIANKYSTPVFPISQGKNWGLGSKLPVTEGCVLVDLRRMNRIHEVNVQHHYAVIEPGVSQKQLYQYLLDHQLPLRLNVIGSGSETSLLGNALERGIGYFATKAESLSGLQIILGNGEILKTGFGHFPQSKTTHHYRHGIGPSLDGLFVQSNFGIVTRGAVDLIPMSEAHFSFLISVEKDLDLSALIDALASLRRQSIVQTVVHLANQTRALITTSPLIYDVCVRMGYPENGKLRDQIADMLKKERIQSWSAVAGVFGTRLQLKAARREIRKSLNGLGKVMFFDDRSRKRAKRITHALACFPYFRRKYILLEAGEPLYGLTKGIPSDAFIQSMHWPLGGEGRGETTSSPDDESQTGFLLALPIMRLSSEDARAVVDLTESISRDHGFTPAITLNVLDSKALEAVVSIAFRRNHPDQVQAAHRWYERYHRELFAKGWIPYRVGVSGFSIILDDKDPFWQIVRDMKKIFDPKGIIAPGRYNLV
jgi:4-cresol dehydrogenase (hydroxylating)